MSKNVLEKIIEDVFSKENVCSDDIEIEYIENHKQEWKMISEVGKCGVFVFDCYTHKFVFASGIGLDLFGLKFEELIKEGHNPVSELIHPDDIPLIIKTRIKAYDFWKSLSADEKTEFKMVHEFRIRNIQGEYVRMSEQEQIIKLDKKGNIWLTMSIINLDASHDAEPIKCHIYNVKTGEQVYINLSDMMEEPLTPREIEILLLMKKGMLSKEICEQLGISIHTVNVHRQNIFQKLHADNAMEAVNYARKLGVL